MDSFERQSFENQVLFWEPELRRIHEEGGYTSDMSKGFRNKLTKYGITCRLYARGRSGPRIFLTRETKRLLGIRG